jgi:hypothetical protein
MHPAFMTSKIELSQGTAAICYEMADAEYRQHPGLSQSAMKELLVSPAHFMARYGPDAPPFYPTTNMILGLGIHCKTLEPELFDAQFVSKADKEKPLTIAQLKAELDASGIDYPKTAKKDELQALLYPGGLPADTRTALDPDAFADVLAASEALRTHDITGQWFSPGSKDYRKNNEVSIFTLNHFGQPIKGRFDRLEYDGMTARIIDLKTTHTASPREFQRTCANFSYDLQAAWYTQLAQMAFPDARAVEFYFVAIERKAPYGISVFKASEGLLQSGRFKMQKALDLYAQCVELDYWPSYDPVVHDLDMPAWAKQAEPTELEAAF